MHCHRHLADVHRLTVGAAGAMANADHLLGALVLTFTVTTTAEVGRAVRNRYGASEVLIR